MTLPPLPEPFLPGHELTQVLGGGIYTADQMRAYAEQVRAAERERCAKVCETLSYRERWIRAGTNGAAIEPCRFAAAIRALK